MFELTLIKTARGDMQMHVAGCSDIKRSHRGYSDEKPATYSGDDLLSAIVTADTDMADWFGQQPYVPNPDDQPWTTSHVEWAPCFAKAVKAAKIVFDTTTHRPMVKGATGAARGAKRTVKVLVQMTVTVDVDAYRTNYGSDDVATIRNDVKHAIVDAVNSGAVLADGIVDVKQW